VKRAAERTAKRTDCGRVDGPVDRARFELQTGDTIMCFGKHEGIKFREVMIHDYDYVCWARSIESPTAPLALFRDWTNSDEGKVLEAEIFASIESDDYFEYGEIDDCYEYGESDDNYEYD
jgi:hypothetical protein